MAQGEQVISVFTDEEVRQGTEELFGYAAFMKGVFNIIPDRLRELFSTVKGQIHTAADVQAKLVYPVLQNIVKHSTSSLTSSGLDQLKPDQSYLFVSNHRDIALDPAFVGMTLFEKELPVCQVAIGDNLVKSRVTELIFKMNKSFVVKRTGSPRERYAYSIQLAKYIHQTIASGSDSIWIAQREGRAKDGNDQTAPGLLKMLSLGSTGNLQNHFRELHIVPVTISYEFDPCALFKTRVHLRKLANPDYHKAFQEDIDHIVQGLLGQKGRVHIHFDHPLNQELNLMADSDTNKKQLEELAAIIDRAIHTNYQLRPVNYVAYDLLYEEARYAHRYTAEEKEQLTYYFLAQFQEFFPQNFEAGRKYLLGMYANPVINASKWS